MHSFSANKVCPYNFEQISTCRTFDPFVYNTFLIMGFISSKIWVNVRFDGLQILFKRSMIFIDCIRAVAQHMLWKLYCIYKHIITALNLFAVFLLIP